MNGRPCGASIHFRGEIVNPARRTRRRAGFYCNFSRGARILLKAFYLGAGLYVSGIARLRGSRACSADGQQDFRCAVRRVGDVGAVSWALWLAAEAASLRGCAVRLRPHRRLSLSPLNNNVFAPPQKHLMHLECIKRACYVRTRTAHVRRKIGWLLLVLCTSFVNIFKTLLLHVALLPEKW